MFPISATGPRRRRAAAGLAAALAAFLAGCGGGGDSTTGSGDQEALKAKLLAAAEKTAEAPSLDATIAIDVTEGDSSETTSLCLALSVIRGETSADEQVVLSTYAGDCGGSASSQVVVIGRDVWASQFGDQWARGRISPQMVDELTAEDDEYDELIAAASEIRPGSAPRSYEFTAPASAFSQTDDLGDLGDPDVDFELGLDERGYLSSLLATIDAEGVNAVIEEEFEVGAVAPLKPPPAGDVVGPVQRVDSEADLESLLESTFSEGFE